uniref:Dermaseptin-PH n=1 Tax=Pithecopus hypochondrialis TaxID=317381 RepID=DRSPH_PITHY|nr:RecName: Full=Dermaseptin-PH; Short=DRS-PH; Flags: Precursor [Pithecopus hypochondrialis]AWK58821.1 dermaseptin-PH precursor [Pithecopus hypochondrialis]
MDILKKSLFLILFLGVVSLSICEEEKRENEEEMEQDDEQSEMKRALWKEVLKNAGKAALNEINNLVQGGQ